MLHDITFVDDNYFDGEEDDIMWGSEVLSNRFHCKEIEWLLLDGAYLDYLGMQLASDIYRSWISMGYYIENCLKYLGWQDIKIRKVPISQPIDEESSILSADDKIKFHTGLGMLSWLSNTARPDMSYTHSRLGQYQANPNASAREGLKQVFGYLKGTKHLQLSVPRVSSDRSLDNEFIFNEDSTGGHGWEFYCDSDFAGNSEPINRRRSQSGYIALLNGARVYWQSKVSLVCFASSDINESHPDTSSTAAEIYAAGNATMGFMHLSYVAEEMGLEFPKPFKLQMDNAAGIAFANNSCFKTKLKHIDCRQEWVKMLRDKKIVETMYVQSAGNLADIFTKILPASVFLRLRTRIMFDPNIEVHDQ